MSLHTPNFLTCPAFPELPPASPPTPAEPASTTNRGEPVSPFHESEEQTPIPVTPTVAPKVRSPHKMGWWIFGSAVVIAVAVTVPAVLTLIKAGSAAASAKTYVQSAQTKIQQLDIAGAQSDLKAASKQLSLVRTTLLGVGMWRDLPFSGTQIRAMEDAASAGISTLDSAADILDVASTIIEALQGGQEATWGLNVGIPPTRKFSELTAQDKLQLLQRLHNQLPRLRLARDKMSLALELWRRVPQDQLASPLRSALKPMAETLPMLQRSLDEAVPLIEVILPLAGYPDARRFLVVLQNADELRPGGGFIGNVGTITTVAGDFKEFEFTDVYNIDNPVSGVWREEPPAPLKKYLGVQKWFLRDANWSPDFPTSAETVLDFYIRETEMQTHQKLVLPPDTYVALEPGLFESLLRLVGPLTVNGITFEADNFFEKLEFEVEVGWHQKGLAVTARKDIVSRLGEELMAKLTALPSARWPEILDLLTQALERKQIMVYSRQPELRKVLEARNWTAAAKPALGDFLWVVDANMAALKTDGAMKKAVKYEVDAADPKGPKATVTLTYTNTAKDFSDYRYTRYRSYTRVYVPEGSELLGTQGAQDDDFNKTGGRYVAGKVDVFKELGKTVFGAFWSVEPNKTATLSFTYRLPESVVQQIKEKKYRLDWPKQPGADKVSLTLELLFGKKIKSAVPAEDQTKWGDARYENKTDSLTDRTFNVILD